ncbi:MAG: hypothetical protein GX594_17015 [Pirellulaceae bacterium]|nr:hypothetical protein [Pirellulaceae bacterium]
MNNLSESHECGCCAGRRRFLAAGCGLCAAALVPGAFGRSASHAAETPGDAKPGRPRVRLVFACLALKQDRPTWPHIGYDFTADIERVTSALQRLCPEVELLPVVAHTPEHAEKLLAADRADRIDGYVIYQMNNWAKAMLPVIASGKPTIVADFIFAGTGGALVYTADLRGKHDNFSLVASSRIEDLAEAVKRFTLLRQGATPAEFAAVCDRLRRARTPAESLSVCKDDSPRIADVSDCLAAMKRSKLISVGKKMRDAAQEAKQQLGIEIVDVSYEEIAAAYEAADRDRARELAARWKSKARSIELDDADATLEGSGRMYLALQDVLKKQQSDAITVECLGGFYGGFFKAYPCLGFTELLDAGMIGACQADILSSVTMIAMKHLVGRPGYISNPAIDTSKRRIIYSHCVATTKPFGPDGPANPYSILTHAEDLSGASVRSFLPEGYMTTTLEIQPARREILCHRAKSVENVVEPRGCRTKLACEVVGDMEKLLTFWDRDRYYWHRVTFFGDFWEPVKELAAALRFKFVEEA